MSEVVLFKPLAEMNALENLDAFIELSRNKLAVFGKELPFDDFIWDVTDYIQIRGKNNRVRLIFSTWETRNNPDPQPMSEPFAAFAKAFIRYQYGFRPVGDNGVRLSALRALCFALGEAGRASPAEADGHILNRAAQLIQDSGSKERAYRVGMNLELISKFLDDKRLVKNQLNWKSHIKRPADTHRVGKEFDERRYEKLPSTEDLEAVAEAYRLAKSPRDVLITSIVAIMCATPDRIAEILTLREDCEYQDRLSDGQDVYGLRYWPAKGADPMVKFVIPSMADLVKDAIARLRMHTESARILARWYEDNPGVLYLPQPLEGLRGRALTPEQVSEVLYGTPDLAAEALAWAKYRKLSCCGFPRQELRISYKDFERAVISSLPDSFPYLDRGLGLKYSGALCVVHPYTFNDHKRTSLFSLASISHGQVSDGLGAREAFGIPSVFARLGITGSNGASLKINTHKFRHYLNTLAMHGGLGDLDIAKWSGRKDVRQNRAYDHVSARDKLALIREAVGDQSKMFGPIGHMPNIPSITRDEFANLKVMNAHTTEFGYCTHDYASTPCQKYLDCLNCNELVCIKGDKEREANIRRQLDETRGLLAAARKGAEDGAYGADRWVDHQTQTLQRLQELCAILENPKVQRGAVIQLKHLPTASRLTQAVQSLGMNLYSQSAPAHGNALLTAIKGTESWFGDVE